MNPEDFKNSPSGQLVPTINGCMAFVPNPLPPKNLDLGNLVNCLADATLVLGELSGIGQALPNPDLLIRPFSRAEAVASSKIEGTVTSFPELLTLELFPDTPRARNDTREVHNYIRALHHGLELLPSLPLSKRLFCSVHAVLLDGVTVDRGARFPPGELKSEQNWIGSRTIQTARFVPPPPDESLDTLDELERFIHRDNEPLPLLIKLALIHYQFETIHPFPDGNGRVGRLIIPLMLCERKAMSQPLLYLSPFFDAHYNEYIDYMLAVSKSGAWEQWIKFFLRGVETAARNSTKKAHELRNLHREYMERIRAARSSVLLAKLVDSLFDVPAITVPFATTLLEISYNAAKNQVRKLVDLQIINPNLPADRPQMYYAHEIIRIASAPDP